MDSTVRLGRPIARPVARRSAVRRPDVRRYVAAVLAACVALAGAGLPPAAAAGDDLPALHGHGFTLYGGWRFGGEFDDANDGESIGLQDDSSLGATLDFALDGQRELQVAYARQSTTLDSARVAPATGDLPMRLESLHVGGTFHGDGLGRGWYAIGGLGVTRLTPSRQATTARREPRHTPASGICSRSVAASACAPKRGRTPCCSTARARCSAREGVPCN